jgi:hypothetical protein
MNPAALIVMLSLIVASPASAQATQFNLRCKGTMEVREIGADKIEPYEKVFRIDLARKKWCEGACEEATSIASVQETQIVLTDYKTESRSMDSYVSERIDRKTGEHDAGLGVRSYGRSAFVSSKSWKGTCEREPFTGFPAVKTKF